MKSYEEKQQRAKALVDEVKADVAKGLEDAESVERQTAKMDEAQRLMSEVRVEKAEDDRKRLTELVEEYEKASATSAPNGNGPIAKGPIVESDQPKPEAAMVDPRTPRLMLDRRSVQQWASLRSIINQAALGEATNAGGGFLVPPQWMQNLFAETRRQGNALRRYGWLTEHPAEGQQILLPTGSGTATVGIVAENAPKPSADQTYGQVTVNVFTWAGISKISRQLAMDASPTAADIVARELGSLLGNLEEQKIINGSGTGEPRGILNVSGIGAVTFTNAGGANAQQLLVAAILDAVTDVQTTYFAPSSGILMHPRRLAWLLKAETTTNAFVFTPNYSSPDFRPALGVTSVSEGTTKPPFNLFGVDIGVSSNIPTNLGAGANEDRVIVGAYQEAHWFQRQDVTMDVSDTAGTSFEQNQVWYRLEERAGFSAERYPGAFAVVSGTGLNLT